MKKLPAFLCVFLLILTLLYPSICQSGLQNGIKICLYTLIPSFFPFLVITNIMIKYELFDDISTVIYPIFHLLFGVSKNGSFVVLNGFTCGYPIGIKTASDMYTAGKISRAEYLHLIKFCNNPGLPFVINYVAYSLLNNQFSIPKLLVCIYGSSAITGLISHLFFYRENQTEIPDNNPSGAHANNQSVFTLAFATILRLSSFVLVFSIIIAFFQAFIIENTLFKVSLIALTEITSGLNFISGLSNPISYIPLILTALTSGGLSISAQTFSLLKAKEDLLEYVKGKSLSILIALSLFFFL